MEGLHLQCLGKFFTPWSSVVSHMRTHRPPLRRHVKSPKNDVPAAENILSTPLDSSSGRAVARTMARTRDARHEHGLKRARARACVGRRERQHAEEGKRGAPSPARSYKRRAAQPSVTTISLRAASLISDDQFKRKTAIWWSRQNPAK